MGFKNPNSKTNDKLKTHSFPVLALIPLICCLCAGCVGPDTAPQSTYGYDYRGQATCQTCPAATVSTCNAGLYNNTVIVTCCNPTVLWESLVTPVRKYFPIQKEDPCRQMGCIVSPGKLITGRTIGSSVFEPWKRDSVGIRQRWESTIQTISRKAVIDVAPQDFNTNTYSIKVEVIKEIENNPHPDTSRTGQGNYFLSDSRRTFTDPIVSPEDETGLTWIEKGRDPLLEQRLLAEIEQSIKRNCR